LFERWLIGSVARQVIAYAHCAVTVVRRPPP
jgi:nucleotide-binding universal stress UspA family protein